MIAGSALADTFDWAFLDELIPGADEIFRLFRTSFRVRPVYRIGPAVSKMLMRARVRINWGAGPFFSKP